MPTDQTIHSSLPQPEFPLSADRDDWSSEALAKDDPRDLWSKTKSPSCFQGVKTRAAFALCSVVCGLSSLVHAQTNVFPSSGNVGIGTASPATSLYLNGPFTPGYMQVAIQSTPSDDRAGISFWSSTGARMASFYADSNHHSYFSGTEYSDGVFHIYTAGAERMVLLANGNVGIGTTTPSRKLTVQGDMLLSDGQRGSLIAHDTYSGSRSFLALDIDSQDGVASGGDYLYLAQESNRAILTSAFGTRLDLGSWVPHISILPEGNVGIGTTTPDAGARVHVAGGILTSAAFSSTTGSTGGLDYFGGGLRLFSVGSSGATKGAYTFIAKGADGSSATQMTIDSSGNVGIGTTTPTHKLAVNGTIRAKEVIVDTGWADHVFKPGYQLASLSEVEGAIKRDGHLPGIPSAAEVAEHGVSMGEMQAKLLAKVEELTLHVIAQEKRMGRLETENAALRHEVETLKSTQ